MEKGITLVALMVTIVIMIILSGIVIGGTIGNNGIFSKAKYAVNKYDEHSTNVDKELNETAEQMEENADEEVLEKAIVNVKCPSNRTINGKRASANNPIVPEGYTPIDAGEAKWGDGSSKPAQSSVDHGLVIKDDEGNETKKQIELVLDDETQLTTYFDEEVKDGLLQLSMGSANSTSSEDLQKYLTQASNFAVLLKTDVMPLTYKLDTNLYVQSEITNDILQKLLIIFLIVAAVIAIFTIIKYKKQGLLAIINLIGFVATLLITIRYANVVVTFTGILAVLLSIIMNYIYILNIIKADKEGKKEHKKISYQFLLIYMPCLIISVVFSFIKNVQVASFGMIMFWAILVMVVYSFLITKALMSNSEDNK